MTTPHREEAPPPPTAQELSVIPTLCTADEWNRLCRCSEFIEASGVSLAAALEAAGRFLGRELDPKAIMRPKPIAPEDF